MPTKKILLNENLWLYLAAAAVLAVVCYVRLRLLGVPMERDEGEYAYIGQQALRGALPYTDSYSMKFPGIYLVYAMILAVFGQTHTGIHFALLLTNIASAFLLFKLGGRLFNTTVGVTAGSSFLVITLGSSVQGVWANAEHFVVLFALGGLLLTLIALEREDKRRLFLSGILLGAGFLIKQHGVFFLLFGFVYICLFYFMKRRALLADSFVKVGLFVMGGLTPLALTALFYWAADSFDAFWFWTFEYAFEYVSLISLDQGIHDFMFRMGRILEPNFLILLLSLLGLAAAAWDKSLRPKYGFSFGFLLFSFLAITPGLYFRPHYFILWIPALSLFAGMGLSGLLSGLSSQWFKIAAVLYIFALSFGVSFYKQRLFLFNLSTTEAARYAYHANPFPESLAVADYINKNSKKEDEVAVLGSEPQIYFYSRRRSATGFLYMYPLMESHRYARLMRDRLIKEIQSAQPAFIVVVNIGSSWADRSVYDPALADWSLGYLQEKYELTGLAHIFSPKKTIYKWGSKAAKRYLAFIRFLPEKNHLLVYKRKT